MITERVLVAVADAEPAPAPARETIDAIGLTGLTIEQQVATLREEATKLAEDLAARFPNEAEAHMLLGDTHRRFGRSAEAMTCWQKASELDPHRASPYDRMAIVAMEKGQFDEALALWRGHAYEEFMYEAFASAEIARLETEIEALREKIERDREEREEQAHAEEKQG